MFNLERVRWIVCLMGLACAIASLVAFSAAGRIDVEDGQARFEVGQSLHDHGDAIVRDSRVFWYIYPGRDGHRYSYYRFPQEWIAAASVFFCDLTGPGTEGRRHFFFALHGAVLAALLAIVYACWFRERGYSPSTALILGAVGFLSSPSWCYAASTYDDTLGALVVVSMLYFASHVHRSHLALVATALLVGLAFHVKPPLVAFMLPAMVLLDHKRFSDMQYALRLVAVSLAVVAAVQIYNVSYRWKFPVELDALHRQIFEEYYPKPFFGNVLEALLDYTIGPSSGMLWYYPPLLLGIIGVCLQRRLVAWSVSLACLAFVGFFSLMTIYKGGVCWGPRYMTPMLAVLWLFAPSAFPRLAQWVVVTLISLGIAVQVLALSIVPERLYVEKEVPTGFFTVDPWLYFRPEISHLRHRPREILDALTSPESPEFTPGPSPTFTMPVMDPPYFPYEKGLAGVRRFTLLNKLRPWWATFPHLPPEQRPVNLQRTAAGFLLLGGCGVVLLIAGSTPFLLRNRRFTGKTSALIGVPSCQ